MGTAAVSEGTAGRPLPLRVAVELALFVVASVLLWSVGLTTFALVLLVTEIVVLVALISTGTPPGTDVDVRPAHTRSER